VSGVAATPTGRTGLRGVGDLLRETFSEWQSDDALGLGAALAYYTIFAMAPLLVLVIALAGLVLGRSAAEGELVGQLESLIGATGAQAIQGMIAQASGPKTGIVASLASIVTMALGATGVFGQLQHALNKMWHAPPPARQGLRAQVRKRAVAFGMILGIGFLLLVSLALSAALAAVHDLLARHAPILSRLLPLLNFMLSFGVITALFALIFKVLPDVEMAWRDVLPGGAVTALLFTVGKSLIGIYLGRAGVTSVYGAAGSFVLVLLWVYYSAQILLLGAEFTEVYSRRYGSRRPSPLSSPA
jgi:membrane protein